MTVYLVDKYRPAKFERYTKTSPVYGLDQDALDILDMLNKSEAEYRLDLGTEDYEVRTIMTGGNIFGGPDSYDEARGRVARDLIADSPALVNLGSCLIVAGFYLAGISAVDMDDADDIDGLCLDWHYGHAGVDDELCQVEQEWFDEEVWPLIADLTDDSDLRDEIVAKVWEDYDAWNASEAYLDTDRFYELVSTEFGLTKKED